MQQALESTAPDQPAYSQLVCLQHASIKVKLKINMATQPRQTMKMSISTIQVECVVVGSAHMLCVSWLKGKHYTLF